jgi:hypothetical protein
VFVTTAKDSKDKDLSKDLKASGDEKGKIEKSSPSTLMCFVCGKLGTELGNVVSEKLQ